MGFFDEKDGGEKYTMIVFLIISLYLMPILAIIFCVNLVIIIKKVKEDLPTTFNTFLLTASFVLIVWSIAVSSFVN